MLAVSVSTQAQACHEQRENSLHQHAMWAGGLITGDKAHLQSRSPLPVARSRMLLVLSRTGCFCAVIIVQLTSDR